MIVILCIRPYFAEQDADLHLQNFSAVFRQLGVNGVLAQDRWAKGVYDWNTVSHQLKAQLHLLEKAVNDVFQLITGEPNGQVHKNEDTVTSFSFLIHHMYTCLLQSSDFSFQLAYNLRKLGLPLTDFPVPRAEIPHGAASGRRHLQWQGKRKVRQVCLQTLPTSRLCLSVQRASKNMKY